MDATTSRPRSATNKEADLLADLQSAHLSVIGSYKLFETIGEGTYGKVKRGVHQLTGSSVAIKIVRKQEQDFSTLVREIDVWRRIHHPHIVQLYEIIVTEDKVHMVMELVRGGDLLTYIGRVGKVAEGKAKMWTRQLVEAVKYCHDRQVVHRDLKLENILLDDHENIKLIDFGFTRQVTRGRLLETYYGSSAYASPEIIVGKRYSGQCADVWSIGVILYTLVCGHFPFDENTEAALHQTITSGQFQIPDHVSFDCRSLIESLLKLNPDERLSVEAMAQHPWLRDAALPLNEPQTPCIDDSTSPFDKFIFDRLAASGIDTIAMQKSLREYRCDSLSALFYILRRNHTIQVSSMKPTSSIPIAINTIPATPPTARSADEVHSIQTGVGYLTKALSQLNPGSARSWRRPSESSSTGSHSPTTTGFERGHRPTSSTSVRRPQSISEEEQ